MIAETETRQEAETPERLAKVFNVKRSCVKCGHVRVCVVHRALLSLLTKHFTEETQPFEASELANICEAYVSASVLARLKEQ